MVKLRLRRIGKKKQPVYKIVVAHSESPRDGKFLESIGTYNPRPNPSEVTINEIRLFHWLKRGAQATDKVLSLIKDKGLWLKWQLTKRGKDEATIAAEMEKWAILHAEKLVRQAEKKATRKKKKKVVVTDAPIVVPTEVPAA